MDELEERLKSHYESLSRAIRFARTADTKAAPALALQIALVGTLAARFEKLLAIFTEGSWDIERAVLLCLIALYVALLITVVVLTARVYMPMNPRTGKSLIYFEDIASMKYRSFKEQASRMSPNMIEIQLLDQVHRVSKIASVKMHRVRWAFMLSVPASVLAIVLLAWGSI